VEARLTITFGLGNRPGGRVTTVLLLGVPDRIGDAIMGWEPGGAARMRARYMHVTDPMLKRVAQQVGGALWGAADATHGKPAEGPPAPN